jgi:hypothetical protein
MAFFAYFVVVYNHKSLMVTVYPNNPHTFPIPPLKPKFASENARLESLDAPMSNPSPWGVCFSHENFSYQAYVPQLNAASSWGAPAASFATSFVLSPLAYPFCHKP